MNGNKINLSDQRKQTFVNYCCTKSKQRNINGFDANNAVALYVFTSLMVQHRHIYSGLFDQSLPLTNQRNFGALQV